MTAQKKHWELPARLAELVGALVLGLVSGFGLALFGIGLLSGPPTTNPTEISTPAAVLTLEEKCAVLVESYAEYGRRTALGPMPADIGEQITELCLIDGININMIPKGEVARLQTECEVWDAGQRFANNYARAVATPQVALTPCPVLGGGPPPVNR